MFVFACVHVHAHMQTQTKHRHRLKPFGTAGKNILLLDSCLRKEKGLGEVVRVFL